MPFLALQKPTQHEKRRAFSLHYILITKKTHRLKNKRCVFEYKKLLHFYNFYKKKL